ncbi:MAG: ABC transporter permease [Bacteroidota bacterium]
MVRFLRPFFASVRISFKMFLVDTPLRFYLSTEVPQLLMRVAFFMLAATYAGGAALGQFALVGNAVQAIAVAIMVPISNMVYIERTSGNLTLVMVTPANKVLTILGREGASFIEGIATTLAVLFLIGPVSGVPLPVLVGALRALPVLPLISLSVAGLALAVACVSFTTRVEVVLANAASSLLMVLAGVNVPLEALPKPLAAIGRCLPLTNGLLAFRAIAAGATYADVFPHLLAEARVAATYVLAGVALFSLQLSRARRYGVEFS